MNDISWLQIRLQVKSEQVKQVCVCSLQDPLEGPCICAAQLLFKSVPVKSFHLSHRTVE